MTIVAVLVGLAIYLALGWFLEPMANEKLDSLFITQYDGQEADIALADKLFFIALWPVIFIAIAFILASDGAVWVWNKCFHS